MKAAPMKQEPIESSSCLLELLATIATQALANDPSLKSISSAEDEDQKSFASVRSKKPRSECNVFNVSKVCRMAPTTLLRHFSLASFDPVGRCFVYTCQMTEHCTWETRSHSNEMRAQNAMKEHLWSHVCDLSQEGKDVELVSVIQGEIDPFEEHVKTHVKCEQYETFGIDDLASPLKRVIEVDHNYSLQNGKNYTKCAKQELSHLECEEEFLSDEDEEDSLAKLCQAHLEQKLNNRSFASEADRDETNVFEGYVVPDASWTPIVGSELELLSANNSPSTLRTSDLNVYEAGHSDSKLLHETGCEDSHMSVSYERENATIVPMDEEEERQLAVEAIASMQKERGKRNNVHRCHLCTPNQFFSNYNTLLTHLRSHAGFRPYTCSVCNTSFTRQHSLNYHMLIHRNETRFTCEFCGKAFRHSAHFKQHVKSVHGEEAGFECSQCMISFRTRVAFKKHLKTVHNKVLTTTGVLVHVQSDPTKKLPLHSKVRRQVKKEVFIKENVATLASPQMQAVPNVVSIQSRSIKQEPSETHVLLSNGNHSNSGLIALEKRSPPNSTLPVNKHKQAFLAKLNGRPVLLIPKELNSSKMSVSPVSLASTERSQNLAKEA